MGFSFNRALESKNVLAGRRSVGSAMTEFVFVWGGAGEGMNRHEEMGGVSRKKEGWGVGQRLCVCVLFSFVLLLWSQRNTQEGVDEVKGALLLGRW